MYEVDDKICMASIRGFPYNLSITHIIRGAIGIPLTFGLYVSLVSTQGLLYKFMFSLITSIISYFACMKLIPNLKHYTLKADIFGIDLNKPGLWDSKPKIPEAVGIVTSVVFLIACTQIEGTIEYSSGLLAITFMILLGFVDDTVDLKWKYKLILPLVASLPLITCYNGVTHIVMPIPLRIIFGVQIELGFLYKVYMSTIAIFCSNSINIHAGINGLEVG